MTVRVEVVTPCDICVANAEYSPAIFPTTHEIRRTFTEWPPEAIEAAQTEMQGWVGYMIEKGDDVTIVDIVAGVLWGHITGDK